MAAIWTRRIQFVAAIGELVGYKSGLALTRQELCDSAPDDYRGIWSGDEDDVLRIRVEVYEEVLAWILFRLGNIPSPSLVPPPTRVILGCKDDPERYRMALDIGQLMPGFLESGLRQAEEQQSRLIDPTPLLEEVYKRHGTTGVRIAGQFLEEINLSLHRSASGVCRQVEWKDTKELDGLFHSESLDTYYGTFLDQRFIDYLGANFDDIDSMNWR
jgi:restriction system protein